MLHRVMFCLHLCLWEISGLVFNHLKSTAKCSQGLIQMPVNELSVSSDKFRQAILQLSIYGTEPQALENCITAVTLCACYLHCSVLVQGSSIMVHSTMYVFCKTLLLEVNRVAMYI